MSENAEHLTGGALIRSAPSAVLGGLGGKILIGR